MELILVRHALPERVENVEGVADPGLQPLGQEQARRLADWLEHEPIDRIVASPKRRAVETAQPLSDRLGLGIEIVPGFSEIDRSSRHYIPVEEMRRENSPVWQALVAGRWRFGWRGRRALGWILAGTALLMLAYLGSKFVLEVLLGR